MEGKLFSEILLPVCLGIIMLGMGLSLEIKDFREIFQNPKALITGLLAQMVLLPGIGFLIAWVFDLEPFYAAGLVLISACPGGAASNLISHLLKANVALSISLTTLNSFLTLVSIPLITNLGLWVFLGQTESIQLPIGETVLRIFMITLLPTVAGIMIRRNASKFAAQLDRPLRFILPAILAFAFTGVIFFDQSENQTKLTEYMPLFLPALFLNFGGMLGGILMGGLMRLKKENRVTISIEVGLQNSALAIFVATSLLSNQSMAIIGVIYGSFTFFSTALFAWIYNRVRS